MSEDFEELKDLALNVPKEALMAATIVNIFQCESMSGHSSSCVTNWSARADKSEISAFDSTVRNTLSMCNNYAFSVGKVAGAEWMLVNRELLWLLRQLSWRELEIPVECLSLVFVGFLRHIPVYVPRSESDTDVKFDKDSWYAGNQITAGCGWVIDVSKAFQGVFKIDDKTYTHREHGYEAHGW